jgi:hypothetical protein
MLNAWSQLRNPQVLGLEHEHVLSSPLTISKYRADSKWLLYTVHDIIVLTGTRHDGVGCIGMIHLHLLLHDQKRADTGANQIITSASDRLMTCISNFGLRHDAITVTTSLDMNPHPCLESCTRCHLPIESSMTCF